MKRFLGDKMWKSTRPDISIMLDRTVWEWNEAAFTLTSSWPENIIALALPISTFRQDKGNVIYTIKGKLNKKSINGDTKNLLSAMEKSKSIGELKTWQCGSYVLVQPVDIINWALIKGFNLSIEMQNLIGIHQIDSPLRKTLCDQIRNQTVAQYLLLDNPKISVGELIKHPWMRRYGTAKPPSHENKSVRLDLDKLFDSPGKPGRPRSNSLREDSRNYTFKAIPEVMQISSESMPQHHIPFLKEVIVIAVRINIEKIGERLLKMFECEFLCEFLHDKIFLLYAKGSKNLVNLMFRFCLEEFRQLYSHPKISIEQQTTMTIGQLKELNKELCLEPFTKEERIFIEQRVQTPIEKLSKSR